MILETYEFDNQNRMLFHPDFHENQGKNWTMEDLEYLCKFWEVDANRNIAFALGRTETTVAQKVSYLKEVNLYEAYKNMNRNW